MKIEWEILTQPEIERINNESLALLEKTGLEVFNPALRKTIAGAGAMVEDTRIRFPREMVRESLKKTPRAFSLYGRDGQEFRMEPGMSLFSTYSDAVFVSDYGASQQRPSTRKDVEDFALLGDALQSVNIVANACHARDKHPDVQLLHTLEAVLSNTLKVQFFAPQNLREAEIACEMASIAGGGGSLAERPTVSMVASTTSPLRLDADSAEVLMFLAKNSIPFVSAPCPMSGATAPFSLAGTLLLQNAENLALITMAQSLRNGCPLFMGGAAGPLDPATGALAYGSPERSLLMAANNQMHRFYGLPSHAASIAVNGWQPDIQTGIERSLIIFVRLMMKPNIWGGAGGLSSGKTVSLEQAVIDDHTVKMCSRFFSGIATGAGMRATDEIERVGPGGNYLTEPSTLELMRSGERYISPLVNMEEDRGASMLERAHGKVREILSEHRSPVPEKTVEELRSYVEKNSKKIS